ncbi:MAG: uroporphyrinogen-III C-methyltransferase [Phycisphaera sp.]|nr:uroporphyrinogen-III C-methyltransferase [Phycisphaera sp.]
MRGPLGGGIINRHRSYRRKGLFPVNLESEKNIKSRPGLPVQVSLVGAGPGDWDLITVRGCEALRHAQVVVFDALANPALLDLAPPDAQFIDVGKRARDHKMSQDDINQTLVDKANEGFYVVRLKGGDPYLFGRGAEEAAYLARHGVTCEVIPGITSGIAAPMFAGVPVTHRKIASTVTLVTGHEEPGKEESSVDYRSLAGLVAAGGTVCFYMGVGRLASIRDEFLKHEATPDTPVALVQWGASPRQRSTRTKLASVVEDVEKSGISSPAIIVVGPVAGVDEPGLDFYTNPQLRPLFGKRVLVTRTRQQASDLSVKLAALGAEVLEAPTIQLVEPDDWTQIDEAIWKLRDYDWVVLTSSNGVEALALRMRLLNLDSRHLANVKIAAIGEATEEALRDKLNITADLIPTRFVAESLAADLIAKHGVDGKIMLLLRADIARPALPALLMDAGAIVTDLPIYQTKIADNLPERVLSALREKSVDWVTFTSSSTASNLVELLGKEKDLLKHARAASIGPITSQTMRDLGVEITVEATRSNIDGLVEAIVSVT